MLNRYRLIIIATIVAVYFTSLVYLLPNYKTLWFSLEFIILPIIYIIGYETLMEKQKQTDEEEKNEIMEKSNKMALEYIKTKNENKQLKQKLKSSSTKSF